MDTNTNMSPEELAGIEDEVLARMVSSSKVATLFKQQRAADALLGTSDILTALKKARDSTGKAGLAKTPSAQSGQVFPTLNYANAKMLREAAPYHSRCLQILAKNTVGLGHKVRKVQKNLRQLMAHDTTLQQVEIQIAMDYWEFGQGYLEVVREDGEITGLHYRSAETVTVHVHGDQDDNVAAPYSYIVQTSSGSEVHVRPFRPNQDFEEELSNSGIDFEEDVELIVFKQDEEDTENPWYSIPHWVSAIKQMELSSIVTEFFYDFFYNRAVPSLAIFMVGDEADKGAVQKVKDEFQTMGGPGQNYRTAVVSIPGADVELVVEKLSAHEKQHEVLKEISAVTAEEILSIHGVPAAVAGIQVPGRMGAANEFVNALMAFQLLQVGQAQVYFSERLGTTLGMDDSIDLSFEDFSPDSEEEGKLPDGNGYISMLDAVNVLMLDAASRMKDPAMSPNRDASQGLARNGREGNAARMGSASRGS